MKNMAKLKYFLILIILVSCVFVYACGKQDSLSSTEAKVKIVTSLFPTYDFARQIGQQKVEVTLLLPPGVEAHSFEPTPADMKRISNADIFIFTGRVMEPWVDDLLKGVENKKLKVIDASEGILPMKLAEEHSGKMLPGDEHGKGIDPHIWLDFANAMKMVDTITDGLSLKDPGNSEFYRSNAEAYKKKITALDHKYEKTLSQCKNKDLVHAGHLAFGYLAARYHLNYMSAYRGLTPDAEPTLKRLTEITNYLKENHINSIFYEELINPKVARAIALETGTNMLMLHGAHNISKDDLAQGVTFLTLMERNLNNLKVGLLCP